VHSAALRLKWRKAAAGLRAVRSYEPHLPRDTPVKCEEVRHE